MRTFIIGANGRTGTEVIDLALAHGHQVTAFVRSLDKIKRVHPHLQVVVGDPRNTESLTRALPGHDVVFSALGVRPQEIFRPITLLQECAASTVAAMTRAQVRRLFVVSAATLFPGAGLRFALVRSLLRHQVRDLEATEQIVTSTPLSWTIVRPPRLTVSSDEHFRAERGRLPERAWSMSFRGVANFMLGAAEAQTYQREIVGLAR